MDTTLLRNLGVNEAIIQALEKSYGDQFDELEIMQGEYDLRLFLKSSGDRNKKPHIVTLPGYFKMKGCSQKIESQIQFALESYSCNDILEFLPASAMTKENLLINGVGVHLSDSHLKLLQYFAQKIVDTESGWVYIQDMRSDGVIPSDGYQPFSRLRSAVAGYLLKKNGKDFIEANGRKQYRLSIDPKNIKFLTKGKS